MLSQAGKPVKACAWPGALPKWAMKALAGPGARTCLTNIQRPSSPSPPPSHWLLEAFPRPHWLLGPRPHGSRTLLPGRWGSSGGTILGMCWTRPGNQATKKVKCWHQPNTELGTWVLRGQGTQAEWQLLFTAISCTPDLLMSFHSVPTTIPLFF